MEYIIYIPYIDPQNSSKTHPSNGPWDSGPSSRPDLGVFGPKTQPRWPTLVLLASRSPINAP